MKKNHAVKYKSREEGEGSILHLSPPSKPPEEELTFRFIFALAFRLLLSLSWL